MHITSKEAFSHKSAMCRPIIHSSSESVSEKTKGIEAEEEIEVKKKKSLPPAYNISMHADFYLSVYNNNSKIPRSTADPIISLLLDLQSTRPDEWSAPMIVLANSFIEEQWR